MEDTVQMADTTERARALAETALANMARLNVAPTPGNFQIWYTDCAGWLPGLSRLLETLEQRAEAFTVERCAELYERFFGTGRQVRLIDETCQRIEATMAQLLGQVGGMSADAGSYSDKLETFSTELDQSGEVHQIRELISGILSETREMHNRASHLETQLADSSQQIEGLRSDLINAQREAHTDGLTGIANRKCFDLELHGATDEVTDTGQPLSLLLADIDHFKAFNDTHGHQVGDQVLKLVAQVLTKCVKGRDLAARYGGEEFGVILPETELEGARNVAEQIRKTVAKNRVRLKSSGQDLGAITLSIGCSQFQPGETLADLIRRADEALYQAKHHGRNCVITAPLPPAVDHSAA